jgi:hypothetical protein
MSSRAAGSTSPSALDETRQLLQQAARRRFGAIPEERLVEHVLAFTDGSDFALRRAALEALERRWAFARRDGLRVVERPEGSRVLGPYTTGRDESARSRRRARAANKRGRTEPRPYSTVLESIEPIRGSCDCMDYLRSSLGLCKHLLVVLEDVHAKKKRPGSPRAEPPGRGRGPELVWDPRIPLRGEVDRLQGLELQDAARKSGRQSASAEAARRIFRRGRLDTKQLESPAARLSILETLHAATRGARPAIGATPAARALVAEELERARRRVEYAAAAKGSLRHVHRLARKLYPYQVEGLERFLRSGRLLLADDMGLGKTTQAIAAAHVLFEAKRVRRGVFVVPAALKSQWHREWEQTSRVPCAVVEGTPDERAARYRGHREGFLIIGYEQLLRDIEHIQRLAPELVVLDEAQRIKNYATKSAVYVKSLSPEYRLVLTGTPMENRLEELASLMDWVDDVALAPKWRLVPWYTVTEGDGAGGRAGARNLDTLRARLAPSMVRRVRREVLDQLPARTDTRVPVEMTPQQRVEHDELTDSIARLVASSRRRPLTQAEFLRLMSLLTRQRIISNGLGQLRFEEIWPAYRDAKPDAALIAGLFSPKLLELRRLVEELVLEQRRKVVVFSQWRRMLRLAEWSVRDLFGRVGARAVYFTGAERPTQRNQSIVDFHDDPDAAMLLLSDAGGVGLNLQRAANACINLELPWNPAVLEQRIGRIYRLGQKRPIDVYHLVSEYGIESRISSVVGTKRALFTGLFDGTSDEVMFDGSASFLSSVESLLEIDQLPEAPAPMDSEAAADDVEAPLVDLDSGEGDDVVPEGLAEIAPAAPVPPPELGALFGALKVERKPDGGVRVDAPPEAAEQLMQVFSGMARLFGDLAGGRPRRQAP